MAHDHHGVPDYKPTATTAADIQYLETPPGAGYEHTDVNVWVIVKFGLWLVISALVVHFGMGLMYQMLIEQAKDTTPVQYPLAVGEQKLPPQPRLQQFPRNEIYDFRLTEQQRLETYGWVDKNAGVVHIPIEEAMRLTLERGLPARPQDASSAQQTPGMMPTDASSGRVMERRRQ